MIIPSDEYKQRLKVAKTWEKKVEVWLNEQGYKTSYHTELDENGNETYQIFVYNNVPYAHPDFTIEFKESNVIVTKYIEVKTQEAFYRNVYNKISKELLNPNKEYVYVTENQFSGYMLLHFLKEVATDIIFIIKCNSDWYSCDIDKLDENKIYVFGKPFGNRQKDESGFYFFDKEILTCIYNK